MSSNKACTLCPAVFLNQVQMALHTIKMHADSPPPPAESACSLEVIEPPERDDRRSQRSAARSPSLAPGIPDYSSLAKCDQCFAMFAHEDMLDNHKEAQHPATKPAEVLTVPSFPCALCSRSYANDANLKRHYRSAHNGTNVAGPKVIEIDDDDEEGAEPITKREPQKVINAPPPAVNAAPTPSKTHDCPTCAYTTTNGPAKLARHINSHHPEHQGQEVKPAVFKCNRCSSAFGDYAALTDHKTTAHGFLPTTTVKAVPDIGVRRKDTTTTHNPAEATKKDNTRYDIYGQTIGGESSVVRQPITVKQPVGRQFRQPITVQQPVGRKYLRPIISKQPAGRTFKCDRCPHLFPSIILKRVHMARHHHPISSTYQGAQIVKNAFRPTTDRWLRSRERDVEIVPADRSEVEDDNQQEYLVQNSHGSSVVRALPKRGLAILRRRAPAIVKERTLQRILPRPPIPMAMPRRTTPLVATTAAMKTFHASKRKFSCQRCSARFSTLLGRLDHMRYMHATTASTQRPPPATQRPPPATQRPPPPTQRTVVIGQAVKALPRKSTPHAPLRRLPAKVMTMCDLCLAEFGSTQDMGRHRIMCAALGSAAAVTRAPTTTAARSTHDATYIVVADSAGRSDAEVGTEEDYEKMWL